MRKYYYTITKIDRKSEKTIHLHVRAKPRFSLREVLAKQDRIIMSLPTMPHNKNEFTVGTGCLRETRRVTFHPEPLDAIACRYGFAIINWKCKTVDILYDYVMEFVFTDASVVGQFLEWLKKQWRGEWIREDA